MGNFLRPAAVLLEVSFELETSNMTETRSMRFAFGYDHFSKMYAILTDTWSISSIA